MDKGTVLIGGMIHQTLTGAEMALRVYYFQQCGVAVPHAQLFAQPRTLIQTCSDETCLEYGYVCISQMNLAYCAFILPCAEFKEFLSALEGMVFTG